VRVACHAGAAAAITAVRILRITATSATRPSNCIRMPGGSSPGGMIDGATRIAIRDTAMPIGPPSADSERVQKSRYTEIKTALRARHSCRNAVIGST
jgi:hypothetical protein